MADIKYFLFSKEQMDIRTETEKKMGRIYMPGEVIVKGVKRFFTEISDTVDSRFNDTIVVTRVDDLSLARYKEPKTLSRS